ncbi:MAG TPA: Crp/Fnr family transcriptional regulator [Terriglobales bacterium]|nr:Crp/Fnr family transcriptional regulator [Terriglobales bacterium]
MQVLDEDSLFLSQMRLFANVNRDYLREFACHLRAHRYERGEVIFHEDDPPGNLFLVKRGAVKVQLLSSDGKRITIAWVGALNFFGTLSCVRGMPRPESAVALTVTEVLLITREQFQAFLREHPETALVFIDLLAERWQSGLDLLQDVAFLEVPARLAKVLLGMTTRSQGLMRLEGEDYSISPSQIELAALVGATRESVNKWIQKFVHLGWVERNGRKLRVLDEQSLRQLLN